MPINYIVYAIGIKGLVSNRVFVPYRESDGTFPVFSEDLQKKNGSDSLQKAENKVTGLAEIEEAVSLIRQPGFRWRLKEYESGQLNIFAAKHIVIREV